MGKKTYLTLLFVLFLATALRLININQSFWLDESAQLVMSSKSLTYIWSGRGGDFHPPLFYFLTHFWLLMGKSEIWLRTLPIIFGIINIYVMYKLSAYIFSDKKAGVVAALILAINPYHIYYSQELRSYSLLCLLGTTSMYYFIQMKYFWTALINSLLLYTHYAGLFLIITQIIYILIYEYSQIKSYLINHIVTCILYLPWITQLLRQLNSGLALDEYLPGWKNLLSVNPLKILPMTLFKLTAGRISFINRFLYGGYVISVLGILFSVFIVARSHRQFLFSWLFLPIFLMMIASLIIPQNQPFRIIYILPAIILLFTKACIRFPKLFITLIIYISLVGNISYFTRPRLQREQWRQTINFLTTKNAPVVIAFTGIFAPITWYNPQLNVIPVISKFPTNQSDLTTNMIPILTASEKIYTLDYLSDITDPNHLIDKQLVQENFRQIQIYNFEGVGFIREYQR